MTDIYIAMGSNVGDRRANLDEAVKRLKENGFKIVKVSDYIETRPYGVRDQAYFLNAALLARASFAPEDTLKKLKKIENDMGRTPERRWGPRIIDLDIIMYGDLVYDSDTLSIPHKDMLNRAFVLSPLAQIAGDAVHPLTGKSIDFHLREIGVDEG